MDEKINFLIKGVNYMALIILNFIIQLLILLVLILIYMRLGKK